MTKFLLILNYYQIIIHNYKKFTFEVFPDVFVYVQNMRMDC